MATPEDDCQQPDRSKEEAAAYIASLALADERQRRGVPEDVSVLLERFVASDDPRQLYPLHEAYRYVMGHSRDESERGVRELYETRKGVAALLAVISRTQKEIRFFLDSWGLAANENCGLPRGEEVKDIREWVPVEAVRFVYDFLAIMPWYCEALRWWARRGDYETCNMHDPHVIALENCSDDALARIHDAGVRAYIDRMAGRPNLPGCEDKAAVERAGKICQLEREFWELAGLERAILVVLARVEERPLTGKRIHAWIRGFRPGTGEDSIRASRSKRLPVAWEIDNNRRQGYFLPDLQKEAVCRALENPPSDEIDAERLKSWANSL